MAKTRQSLLACLCGLALLIGSFCSRAAVVVDGTLGIAGPIAGPDYAIPASVGRQVGTNLFHSFGTFGIATGETATFSGPAGIANIISRVTGGASSGIDGLLRSTIDGANFYLVNPAGIVFGPNASLNVSGSFYASTAHYIRLADGGRFDVAAPSNSVLTTAPPAAFGFIGPTAAITLNGSSLAVPAGKTLALIGGDVSASGGQPASGLTARSGAIVIASAASAGEAVLAPGSVDTSSLSVQGKVSITGGATLNANESGFGGGGAIFIRGGQLVIEDSTLAAHTRIGNGRGIDIAVKGTAAISGQGADQTITTTTLGGPGNAGGIALRAQRIVLANGAQIDSSSDPDAFTGVGGSGLGGPVTIAATESIAIEGAATGQTLTGIASNAFGSGNAGAITIEAPRVALSGLAAIQSATANTGRSGSIAINAGDLDILAGAQISSATQGPGAGGSISITATGNVTISGMTPDGAFPSFLVTDAFAGGAGGVVTVNAAAVRVLNGGEISSTSRQSATGPGGGVRVNASGAIEVAGIGSNGQSSAIVANTFGSAKAGTVELTAGRLDVRDSGRVQSQTQGTGDGGDISIRVGSLNLDSFGQISADTRQTGRGGSITALVDGAFTVAGVDSGLFANAYLSGDSGNIDARAGTVTFADGGGIFAFSQGRGRAGDITIGAGSMTMTGGARVSVQSFGAGDAGNIGVDAGSALRLDGSSITTEAQRADGGNIAIRARDLITLDRSVITATVQGGLGNGGNIDVDPAVIVLNHSNIIANAFGGNGGNIRIVAEQFLRSPDSIISASSQLGISGTVVIASPIADLTGALEALPAAYLDTGALLANACAARLAGRASSLVLAGRGGLPESPEEPIVSVTAGLPAAPGWTVLDAPRLAIPFTPLSLACAM